MLTATPNSGYKFVGFFTKYGPVDGFNCYTGRLSSTADNKTTITMNSSKKIYALFSSNSYGFDHIDVELTGRLTIEHKINGVTTSTQTLNVTVSDPSLTYDGNTITTFDEETSTEFRKFFNPRISWPSSVTISATLTDQSGHVYYINDYEFTADEIKEAYALCPGTESGQNKGFDFVINAQNIISEITHKVEFEATAGGTLTGNSSYSGILHGKKLSEYSYAVPSPSATAGYHFAGWKDEDENTYANAAAISALVINEDKTFTAEFEKDDVLFTVKNMNGHGGAHGYMTVSYNGGTPVDLTYGQSHQFIYDAAAGNVSIAFHAYADWAFEYYVVQNGASHIDANPDSIDPAGYLSNNYTIEINPKWYSSDISVTGYDGVYNGQQHSVTVNGTETGDTITYSTDGGTTYSGTKPMYTNVNTPSGNEVYVQVERDGEVIYTGSAVVKISPVELTRYRM
jgi:hypothetical protein